ncbi:MAG: DUF4294 domain-containing protein, partial [Bacteroidetes bacterium]|nr:DUF4294 domain-containing protein [Bacteroidota bacterium]
MKKILAILSFLFAFSAISSGQDEHGTVCRLVVVDGDTLPYATLPVVRIYGEKVFKSQRQRRLYDKLVRNVKKVYPYAKLAGMKMREYEKMLAPIEDKSKRKELMKLAEASLKAEFEDDIRKMTFSQGKILIKLIDRETGETSYEIVKELRGGLQAFFWQQLGRLFGVNLKEDYDPKEEDKMI